MMRFLAGRNVASVLAGCMAIYVHHQVLAQTTAPGALPEIRVDASAETETATSPVIGYRARNAATATKTDTPLSETPQSVTVVTRDQIVDQGANNLQDALNYAAGVRSDAYGLDSRTDSVRVRGATPDIYLDGLRQSYGYYTSTTRTEPYTLERLEVLRGPSGMLFGAGTAAGVVNMVSKRPLQETQREVGVQFGSFGRKQIQADLTGPLNADGSLSYRLIALQRKSDTQVDFVPDDRSVIAPSLTWRPSAATSLTLQGLWQKDKSGSSSQFLPWEGTLLPNPNGRVPTSRFIGEPGFDYYDSERKTFGWQFEHKFNDSWTVRQNFRAARNENDNRYHYGAAFSGAESWDATDPIFKRVLGRYYDSYLTRNRTQTLDNHVEGHFQTGALKHTLLVGADFARQREDVWGGTTFDTIDVYAPVYGHVDLPERTAMPRTRQRQNGFYLQDQIKLDNWIFVAGLRHDKAVSSAEGSDAEKSSATTKRFGVMYAMPSGWSPYLSYSESFTPQSPRNGQIFTPFARRAMGSRREVRAEGSRAGVQRGGLRSAREEPDHFAVDECVHASRQDQDPGRGTRGQGLDRSEPRPDCPLQLHRCRRADRRPAEAPGQRLGQVPFLDRRPQRVLGRRGRTHDEFVPRPAIRRGPADSGRHAARCGTRL
jgi:iron complex outermembrane receptor protein